MKIESYTIANVHEEFDCDWCAMPVYVHDSAYATDAAPNRAFCSRYCAKKHVDDAAEPQVPVCKAHYYDGCVQCFGN